MVQVNKEYKEIEIEDYSDLVAEPQFELFFNKTTASWDNIILLNNLNCRFNFV